MGFCSLNAVFLYFAMTASVVAIEWSATSPSDNAVVWACVGKDVSFGWQYKAVSAATVEDIKWYKVDERSNELIAMFTNASGNFMIMPSFSGRVRRHGNAGLTLTGVTIGDGGNYTVEVNVLNSTGTHFKIVRTVTLNTADAPLTSGGLTVQQSPVAVRDNETGAWHVQLTCGPFSDLGQPPVGVVWTTPDGKSVPSTSYSDGKFRLLLQNPIQGGNYSCSVPRTDPAASCVPDDDAMFVGAVSSVEGVLARLNLLEAHQQDLLMQNTELKTELATQKTELAQQKAETAQLKDQLEQAEFGNLTQGSASPPPVSFHASLSRTAHVPAHYPIILDHVYNNEGDAYSPANGSFTVPFNGTYFFIASTGTENARNQDAWMRLVVDHEFVGYTIPRHSDWYEFGTVHAAMHLHSGQRVWLYCYGLNGTFHADTTYFSGFLVRAD